MLARSVLAALVLQVAPMRPGTRFDAFIQNAATTIPRFDAFIQRFGRTYSADSSEHAMRRAHYQERAQAAVEHNANPSRLWDAGVNHLWDWTPEEFSRLNGYRPHTRSRRPSDSASALLQKNEHDDQILDKTASKTWHLRALKPVDQGGCGSCWAVSAATVLEANAEIAGLNRTFSAQHLVNCVKNPHHCGGSGGCAGATAELAFDHAKLEGMPTAAEEPYKGSDGACRSELAAPVQGLVGWVTLPTNEYQPLMSAVANRGPVVVSVGATLWSLYSRGIFDACGANTVVNHAVVLVGFGSEDGKGYYKIQNSWGRHWGEKGHIRLLRTDHEEEHCGVDTKPLDGVGCEGGPSEVRVCGMCGILLDASIPEFRV